MLSDAAYEELQKLGQNNWPTIAKIRAQRSTINDFLNSKRHLKHNFCF